MRGSRAGGSALTAALCAALLLGGCSARSSGGPDRLAALPAETALASAPPAAEPAPATVATVPPHPPPGGLSGPTADARGTTARKAKLSAAQAKVKAKVKVKARARVRAKVGSRARSTPRERSAVTTQAVPAAAAAQPADGLAAIPPELRAYVEMLRRAADAAS